MTMVANKLVINAYDENGNLVGLGEFTFANVISVQMMRDMIAGYGNETYTNN